MSLALIRVDDRLVHGQVVLAWGQTLGIRRLLVADDEVASQPWESDLMKSVAEGMEVIVFAPSATPEELERESARRGDAILLLRSPGAARQAVEAGAKLPEINLGGLHFAPGKDRFLDYLYLDADDRRDLAWLRDRGVRLFAQDVPTSRAVEIVELLAAHGDGGDA